LDFDLKVTLIGGTGGPGAPHDDGFSRVSSEFALEGLATRVRLGNHNFEADACASLSAEQGWFATDLAQNWCIRQCAISERHIIEVCGGRLLEKCEQD
jgi:hypothetical protein